MRETISRPARRALVAVNFTGLLGAFLAFNAGEYGGWSSALAAAAVFCVLVVAVSFHLCFVRTGVWRMVRAESSALDEREVALVLKAFQGSYRVFTAVSLLLVVAMTASVRFSMLTTTFRGHYSFGLAALISLNYLVQALPASIVASRERTIYTA